MLGMVTQSPAPGCPIRRSTGQWVFAPNRGFSQLITSFFASKSLGILHVPFSPFLILSPASLNGNIHQVCFVVRTSFRLPDRSFFSIYSFLSFVPQYLPRSSFVASARSAPISRFASSMSMSSFCFVVPGRVELPTSTLSV